MGLIRIRNVKKERLHDGQKKNIKKASNGQQNTTQKTRDRATLTPIKNESELECSIVISKYNKQCIQYFL